MGEAVPESSTALALSRNAADASEKSRAEMKSKTSPAMKAPFSGKACPTGSESISFEQTNPKAEGSLSHKRYQKYKKAKTAEQAMRLGAAQGDLKHDFGKGYLKRC